MIDENGNVLYDLILYLIEKVTGCEFFFSKFPENCPRIEELILTHPILLIEENSSHVLKCGIFIIITLD